MKPENASDPIAELLALEPLFHRPELGTDNLSFERMMTADFWEVGASGRVHTREEVLRALADRDHDDPWPWEIDEARCRAVGEAGFLLTYRLRSPAGESRRATLWVRSGEEWRAAYHQGTPTKPHP